MGIPWEAESRETTDGFVEPEVLCPGSWTQWPVSGPCLPSGAASKLVLRVLMGLACPSLSMPSAGLKAVLGLGAVPDSRLACLRFPAPLLRAGASARA